MRLIVARSQRMISEKVCDSPITYFIEGPEVHLQVALELGSRVPCVSHRITISDAEHVLYELRFHSQEPEGLLESIIDALVNEVVKPDQLYEFAFLFGGTCLSLLDPLLPTPPKSILN